MASRAAYAQLAAEEEFGLVTKGLLMLCKHDRTLHEEAAMAGRARDLGIEAQVLDAAQTAALDPGIRMAVAGSVHHPHDCHLQPGRYVALLEERIRAAAGELLYGTEATGFRQAERPARGGDHPSRRSRGG